jgi:hypothetical protein
MVIDLTNLRMSDRFTHKIKVHPRSWSIKKPIHRFKVVLNYGNGSGRISHHATRECAEQSIREFSELSSIGEWEIYRI